MVEKPILFNTEMVRAILDGRKTQTRRLVKGLPFENLWFAARFCTVQSGDILWVRETWAKMPYGYVYRADDEEPEGWDSADRWHPSIHMPRDAARLFLRVRNVRVERIQQMKFSDFRSEGIPGSCPEYDFMDLWDSTIKKADLPRYGWEANPWVYVIDFERVDYYEKM